MTRSLRLRGLLALAIAAILALSLAACGATKKVNATSTGDLNIAELSTSFIDNFNFMSPTLTSTPPGSDLVYEPLIKYSPTNGYTPEPWLATKWVWSDGGKTLTWTLRADVKWSDGQPFTSKDLAFTLGLLKNPQLSQGNPGTIDSVDTPDATTAVVHYATPSYAGFGRYYSVKILPQHIWANQDPVKFTDPSPVGTGPFTLKNFGLQQVTYQLNPTYWGGKSKGVQTVNFQAVGTAGGILQNLLTGKTDYAESPLIGNPANTYVAKDPATNKFWLPTPGAGQALLFNNAVAPTNDMNVRQALYNALDAAQLLTLTPGAYKTVANVTGVNEPAYTSWLDPTYRGKDQKQDPSAAKAALQASGYTVQGGNLTKNGTSYPLTLKVDPADPSTPWATGIAAQVQQVLGIKITVDQQSQNSTAATNGTYTLALGPDTPGQGLLGGLTFDTAAPTAVGSPAPTNWARANDPAAVDLVTQMGATADVATQQALAFKVEKILVDQRFTAPIAAYSWQIAFNTKHWSGWPDPSNPATVPSNGRGDLIQTIMSLTPAST